RATRWSASRRSWPYPSSGRPWRTAPRRSSGCRRSSAGCPVAAWADRARTPVFGVSPIIGGSPVRGMADRCLQTLGVEVSATGVGALYGSRRDGGLLDGWLVDPDDDGADVPGITI